MYFYYTQHAFSGGLPRSTLSVWLRLTTSNKRKCYVKFVSLMCFTTYELIIVICGFINFVRSFVASLLCWTTLILFRVDTEAARRWGAPVTWRALGDDVRRTLPTSTSEHRRARWPTGRQVRGRRLRRDQQHVLAAFGDDGLRRRQHAASARLLYPLSCPPSYLPQSKSVALSCCFFKSVRRTLIELTL